MPDTNLFLTCVVSEQRFRIKLSVAPGRQAEPTCEFTDTKVDHVKKFRCRQGTRVTTLSILSTRSNTILTLCEVEIFGFEGERSFILGRLKNKRTIWSNKSHELISNEPIAFSNNTPTAVKKRQGYRVFICR